MTNSGIENVGVQENKGNYANTEKSSANSLYKNYRKYVIGTGKTPLSYAAWITWAKEKGLIPATFNAEADKDVEKTEGEAVAEAVGKSTTIVLTVLALSLIALLGYQLINNKENK